MLRRWLIAFTIVLVTVAAYADPGQAPASSPSNTELRQQYADTLAKSKQDQAETHARNLKLMARMEAMATRQEELMKRQEEHVARFEKILAVWERQQAEYQNYLNSLPKK